MERDPELDAFKREINLVAFIAHHGYLLRARESSRSSKILVHPSTNDKVVVARSEDGHWIYFSVRDARDHGTILDFVQQREALSLGKVRIVLRSWLAQPKLVLPERAAGVVTSAPDLMRVKVAYESARIDSNSVYLNARGLRPRTLREPRFLRTWRIDWRGNVLFGHYDRDGLTGFELKNTGFTGFAAGGRKGLWCSAPGKEDEQLVIVESAIDALSYHQLKPRERARYVSTAGEPSALQQKLLACALEELAPGTEIIAATDSDIGGERFAAVIERMTRLCPGLRYRRDAPRGHKDWNDALRLVEAEYIEALSSRQRSAAESER